MLKVIQNQMEIENDRKQKEIDDFNEKLKDDSKTIDCLKK